MDSLRPILLINILLFSNANKYANKCSSMTTCSDCLNLKSMSPDHCDWCPSTNDCHAALSIYNTCNSESNIHFADTCPTDTISLPPPDFLPNWMAQTNSVIGELTILDLSLPGTHDSLTYDLSTTISEGGIDDYPALSKLLHTFSSTIDLIPGVVEDFIRLQARTQGLTITQQLENGIRFIDFRHMREKSKSDWYSLHCVQSKKSSIAYLNEIKAWMLAHPQEIVVVWMSKHGSQDATGNDAFPGVSVKEKQDYWFDIVDMFSGIILDTTISSLNSTSINELINRDHRFIPYVSDYVEFTGSLSNFAIDGALIHNELGSSLENEVDAYNSELSAFKTASATKASDKKSNKLYLRSMASSSPGCQVEAAAYLKFDPFADKNEQLRACTSECFKNLTSLNYCPETLMDLANLGAYYKQISLEEAYQNFDEGWSFPNAIYLDAVDYDGSTRVGTNLPWGVVKEDETSGEEGVQRYPYVDTLIGVNLKSACREKKEEEGGDCERLIKMVEERRAKYEMKRWSDVKYGRSERWPEQLSDENDNDNINDNDDDDDCQNDLCHVCVPSDMSLAGNCCDRTNTCVFDLVFKEFICIPNYPWICADNMRRAEETNSPV